MSTASRRYRRGDTSSERPGLVFVRYKGVKEVWGTPETLDRKKQIGRKSNAKQRKKPGYKEKMREYFQGYNKRPHQKARLAAYYKQPEVRARYRDKSRNNPERLARMEALAKKKAEREAFKLTPEYAALETEKNRAQYQRNRKNIIANAVARVRANPELRLKQNISRRIRKCLEFINCRKDSATVQLLGCTIPEFKAHLESQFEPGMSWDNYSRDGWHIDHRVPLAAFNLFDPHQQRLAFNFENCRPMWKTANLKKSDKIEGELFSARQLKKANIIPFRQVA